MPRRFPDPLAAWCKARLLPADDPPTERCAKHNVGYTAMHERTEVIRGVEHGDAFAIISPALWIHYSCGCNGEITWDRRKVLLK